MSAVPRLSVPDLFEQLPFSDAMVRSTLGNLIEGGLIEAWGQGGSRTYTLSKSVYVRVGEGIGYVRQADIDKVRHEELILKLAKQNDGVITKRDVEQLLHVGDKQAYRRILKLVQEGKLEKVGAGRATRYLLV